MTGLWQIMIGLWLISNGLERRFYFNCTSTELTHSLKSSMLRLYIWYIWTVFWLDIELDCISVMVWLQPNLDCFRPGFVWTLICRPFFFDLTRTRHNCFENWFQMDFDLTSMWLWLNIAWASYRPDFNWTSTGF